ncbi:MAG: dihydroxyacetone kinase subunit L [Spirochaetaceae bacterium]|nr:dihydroxyacetone kinase subunit L [Spirochaetaceae bacterium]
METDLGPCAHEMLRVFYETAPSTLGTISSMFLMGMAKSIKGKTDADLAQIVDALDAGLFFVMEKAGAKQGSEATKKMKSVHGRAAYYAEKSIGVLDGGSVAGRLVFESLARWAKE